MKKILAEITSGQFAKEWRAEYEGGMKNFKRLYEADNNHPVEVTGRRLRKMMPWLKAKEPPKRVRTRARVPRTSLARCCHHQVDRRLPAGICASGEPEIFGPERFDLAILTVPVAEKIAAEVVHVAVGFVARGSVAVVPVGEVAGVDAEVGARAGPRHRDVDAPGNFLKHDDLRRRSNLHRLASSPPRYRRSSYRSKASAPSYRCWRRRRRSEEGVYPSWPQRSAGNFPRNTRRRLSGGLARHWQVIKSHGCEYSAGKILVAGLGIDQQRDADLPEIAETLDSLADALRWQATEEEPQSVRR